MLTNDATNRLDAINDAMALVTLMDELIGHRKIGGQIDLSDRAASGLSLVLEHVVEVLGDAATGLCQASEEIAAAQATARNACRAPAPAAEKAAPSPSGPSLTEPVPEQERADIRQGQQSA